MYNIFFCSSSISQRPVSPKRSIKTSNEPATSNQTTRESSRERARSRFVLFFFFPPQTRQTPLEFRYSNHGTRRLRFYADDRPLNRRKRGTVRPLPLQITLHIVSRRVLKKNFVKRLCWSQVSNTILFCGCKD